MPRSASVLALLGSCAHVAWCDGNVGGVAPKRRTTRLASGRTNFVRGHDLTEDIEFWTRMTKAEGSMPPLPPSPTTAMPETPIPVTPSPMASSGTTVPVTPNPTTSPDTTVPVTPSPTYLPETPVPVTPNPTALPETPVPDTPSPTVALPETQSPTLLSTDPDPVPVTTSPTAVPETPVPVTPSPTVALPETQSPTLLSTDPDPVPVTTSPTAVPETTSPTASPETPIPVTPSPTSLPTPIPSTRRPTTPRPTTSDPTSSDPTSSEPTVLRCNYLTPEELAEEFRKMALTVTDESTLDDGSSPQAKALSWLINDDAIDPPVCPDDGACKSLQRYVMASFYYASGGGTWTQCNAPTEYTPDAIAAANELCDLVVTPFPVTNPRLGDMDSDAWLTPVNLCSWGAVACWGTDDARYGCMDQIDFENAGLSGTLISEMANLEELRFYILEQGDISGSIPTQYGLFNELLILDMDFNALTGQIPEELFNMAGLQQLDLNDNALTGSISTNIGQMSTLTFLQLDHNKLTGTIPTEAGDMTELRIAFFNDNDLVGTVPAEVCANRNNTNPPGMLGTLVVDCNPPDSPEVECSCCSSCNIES